MPGLSNDNVVLDTDTSDAPVLVEDSTVDILAGIGVVEIWLDDEAAEVNLIAVVSRITNS